MQTKPMGKQDFFDCRCNRVATVATDEKKMGKNYMRPASSRRAGRQALALRVGLRFRCARLMYP